MANAWYYIPVFEREGLPTPTTIINDGVLVGYNLEDRDAAIIMSEEAGVGKAAYYATDGTAPYNIGFVLAIDVANWDAVRNASGCYRVLYYDGDWEEDTTRIVGAQFHGVYGRLHYSASTTVITTVKLETMKPYIPYYGSLEEALAAMDTGTWDPQEPVPPQPGQPEPEDSDPFLPGGTTGSVSVGGDGSFTLESDSIDFPSLPTVSAASTGFITLFNPSSAELNALSSYMWSGLFDIDTFRKIFANPMDCILGLSLVPVAVPSAGASEVKVGNMGTGISMTKAATQYVEVDCGSITITKFWGAYLDFSPYTKAEIYLPYCGAHPLNVDDIMGKTVHVKYHVDILSGACCAYVKCGDSVLYSFVGQCSASIPVSGNEWTNVVNGALSIAASVGTLVASGGLSAPVSASAAGGAAAMGAATATNVMNMKPTVEKSGAMGGVGGMLAIQKPYITFTVPRQALPSFQNTFTGYPSYMTVALSSLSGFTRVYDIHLKNVSATDAEKTEIISLLKEGVVL